MMKTPGFGISCFNYEPSRLEAAEAVSKILSSDRKNLGQLEKAVYELLGTRKTAEERKNIENAAGEKFQEQYLAKIDNSSKNTRFTSRLDNSQWIFFFNEYPSCGREKDDFKGEKVEVQYKSFFSIPALRNAAECIKNAYALADNIGELVNAAEKTTLAADDRITFKVPKNPAKAIFYSGNLVVYYQKPDSSELVEKEFGSALARAGITERNSGRQRGFDFKSEFDFSGLNGSHTQLISRIIAGGLSKTCGQYEPSVLSSIITRQAEELYQLSPKQIASLIQRA